MKPKAKKAKIDEDYLIGYSNDEFIKTQLDELYSGIKSKTKSDAAPLILALTSLKASKKLTIEEAFDLHAAKKTVWPLPQTFVLPNGTFKFFPPEQVIVAGGDCYRSSSKTFPDTNLLCVVPDKFFQAKDYLNGRYVVKRALYLVHLIPKLLKCDFVENISFKHRNADVLKPVLRIKIKSSGSFNIIPVFNKAAFKSSLLHQDKNALRPDKIFEEFQGDCEESSTPFYNSSILSDILNDELREFIRTASESDSFSKSLTVLNFWCKRKDLGIGSHTLSLVVFHMFKIGLLTMEMDALTILKKVWSYLSSTFPSAVSRAVQLGSATDAAVSPGFFSAEMGNILYNTLPSAIVELARHSQIMLGILDTRDYNTFLPVITEQVASCFDLYDIVYEVEIPTEVARQKSLQYCGVAFLGIIDSMESFLKQAYGDRVQDIKLSYKLLKSWSRKKALSLPTQVTVSLSINKENWTRQVDRGPSADTPQSKVFKEFWGDRSQLRRFQDGSIIQAVVWDGKTAKERRGIVTQITKHVLDKHLSISPENVHEIRLESESLVGRDYYQGDGEEQAQKIISTFTELSKILRKCSKIPLSITSVLGVSPVLRNTDLFPQVEYQAKRGKQMAFPNPAGSAPPFVQAHEIICHFAMSGKWPEDIQGILRLKAAFYLALKEELESLHITARVNPNFLDIARNGFVFRLRFHVPKESKLRAANISFWVPSSAEELKVQTETLPLVSSHLTSFSLLHSAFPLTVRYLKRWVASHQLSNCIPDIFCELVAAHLFLSDKSYSAPQTATAGFLRLLSFLSSFDWDLYPLLLHFNGELTSETRELYSNFMNTRKVHPHACVVCPGNERSELTREYPTKTSLAILKLLAKASLSSPLSSSLSTPITSLFTPDTSSYNVVIHLKKSQTGRHTADSESREHHAKGSYFPVVDYEPVSRYVEELTQLYGYLAIFMYNKYSPATVGVVLRKQSNAEEKFTVNGSMGRVQGSEGRVTDNLDVMVSDFDLIGKGLVQSVEVRKLEF